MLAAIVCALIVVTPSAHAQDSVAQFYKGKTIDLIIGTAPGGGYDIYSRIIAHTLPRYIPGEPSVVPRNMPGAGSRRATLQIYNGAKDGLAIAAIFPGAVIEPLFTGIEAARYDPAKLAYLGSANNEVSLCLARADSKVKSLADAQRTELIVGATQSSGSTRDFPLLLNKTVGTKFRLVGGYPGSREITLALDRGEVEGVCGYHWSSLVSQKPEWLSEKKVTVLVQLGFKSHPDADKLGVPQIWEFVKNETDKRVIELVLGQLVVGRPYVTAPGTPPERVAALRAAFARTMQDKNFLAEAQNAKLDVDPAPGDEVQRLLERMYATPPELIKRAAEAIGFKPSEAN
jgi:tripartite-type tricarboxylate transporter receptor subunit TctC